MSTSSWRSAKRRASSFARSRTSPTSRSSRNASSEITSSDRRRAASSSRTPSRSAATWPRIAVSGVRSSCDTDMRKLRESCSDSASLAVISPKRAASRSTSLPPVRSGSDDVVVAHGDLVRSPRERLERSRDPAREVEDEDAGDGNPDPERERELPRELEPAAAQRGLRLRDDERPRVDRPELDCLRNAEIGGAAYVEVERRRFGAPECRGRHGTTRELGQRPGEQRGSRARRAPRTPCRRRARS